MNWFRYTRRLLALAGIMGVVLYAFILILDPYQNVPFSPPFDRAPIATNQRFSYPAVARDPRFDALVMGTSTSRLLDPESLGALTGAHFANLAMNSATAYEQQRIHELFVRHHPDLRYLVLGVDEIWCTRADDPDQYTFREFPEWMYDENPWNDLVYLFNDKALEEAVRMLELLLDLRGPKYRSDGYRDFTADFPVYDRAAVAKRLHAPGGRDDNADMPVLPALLRPDWHYVMLEELARLVADTPPETRIVLFFPPLHARYTAKRVASFAECKGRVLDMFQDKPQVEVLDYLSVSPLTRNDDNYWDPLHFTREVSQLIERDIAVVLGGVGSLSADVRRYPADAQPGPD